MSPRYWLNMAQSFMLWIKMDIRHWSWSVWCRMGIISKLIHDYPNLMKRWLNLARVLTVHKMIFVQLLKRFLMVIFIIKNSNFYCYYNQMIELLHSGDYDVMRTILQRQLISADNICSDLGEKTPLIKAAEIGNENLMILESFIIIIGPIIVVCRWRPDIWLFDWYSKCEFRESKWCNCSPCCRNQWYIDKKIFWKKLTHQHWNILLFLDNEHFVRSLINYGALINLRDKHGCTPLMRAAEFSKCVL